MGKPIDRPLSDTVLYLKGMWYFLADMHVHGAWENKQDAEAALEEHLRTAKKKEPS